MRHLLFTLVLISLPAATAYAADPAAGQTVYNAKCKMCHGADGAGGAMDKASIAGTAEATTKAVVEKGMGKMKPVTSVSGAAVDDVAAYIASLKR